MEREVTGELGLDDVAIQSARKRQRLSGRDADGKIIASLKFSTDDVDEEDAAIDEGLDILD